MVPLKTWQLLGLLVLVILTIVVLFRYSRSLAQREGDARPPVAAAAFWVQE
ncbi:MAG: hypothetical protein KGM44_02310 [bacterium]|nr:hypothetical protein [bacterium]